MVGDNPSLRTCPREAPLPLPLAKTLRMPAVMPLAAAVYCSSPTSITQAPRPIGTFFSSPGGTSERIFLYFAEVVAADRTGEGGGIAGEEDIAVVRLSSDELFRRLTSHQIQDPKLAIAAYWLKDFLARTAAH